MKISTPRKKSMGLCEKDIQKVKIKKNNRTYIKDRMS